MKLTQSRIESLIDTLNDLICDERSLTREQRENMVRTVAILGGLGERQRLIAAEDEALEVAGSGKKAEKGSDAQWNENSR
ncbi:hypothetical protein KHP34_19905 (plasmid) [Enterobacter hormaechei subsp. xiangfangensis]|uniref:hypothetical protein n=1 Tax=Enterobacter hormaechei TaxID=158836 RepID=UPI00287443D2|nr:hypothetical protein [Enterobacter hormaechei]MDS0040591.1 hypothetical protein [Enterobacter hormaechei subsp. xiangfangensis]